MKLNQLIALRGDLTSALAAVQAAIDVQVRDDAKARREKRKPKGDPRTPSRDERVAVIREIAADLLGRVQIFNNLRKSGSRSVKVWCRMDSHTIRKLEREVALQIPDATFELRKPHYGDGNYLAIILPALTIC